MASSRSQLPEGKAFHEKKQKYNGNVTVLSNIFQVSFVHLRLVEVNSAVTGVMSLTVCMLCREGYIV